MKKTIQIQNKILDYILSLERLKNNNYILIREIFDWKNKSEIEFEWLQLNIKEFDIFKDYLDYFIFIEHSNDYKTKKLTITIKDIFNDDLDVFEAEKILSLNNNPNNYFTLYTIPSRNKKFLQKIENGEFVNLTDIKPDFDKYIGIRDKNLKLVSIFYTYKDLETGLLFVKPYSNKPEFNEKVEGYNIDLIKLNKMWIYICLF